MSKFKLITDGLVKNNPTFVLLLGMCPTLATTTSAVNGLSMGLATLFVLVLSNMAISAIAPVVPDKATVPEGNTISFFQGGKKICSFLWEGDTTSLKIILLLFSCPVMSDSF